MKSTIRLTCASFLFAAALVSQNQALIVNLNVMKNGKSTGRPAEIVIRFNDRSIRVPVRSGKFEVPSEVTQAQKVSIQTMVGSSRLSLTNVRGTDFTEKNWTLVLADKAYAEEYMWAVPAGTIVRRTCLVVFESPGNDPGRVLFERNCR